MLNPSPARPEPDPSPDPPQARSRPDGAASCGVDLCAAQLPAHKREAALATCTCGDTAGVLLGEATGLIMQWCLYAGLRLPASGQCPFF